MMRNAGVHGITCTPALTQPAPALTCPPRSLAQPCMDVYFQHQYFTGGVPQYHPWWFDMTFGYQALIREWEGRVSSSACRPAGTLGSASGGDSVPGRLSVSSGLGGWRDQDGGQCWWAGGEEGSQAVRRRRAHALTLRPQPPPPRACAQLHYASTHDKVYPADVAIFLSPEFNQDYYRWVIARAGA